MCKQIRTNSLKNQITYKLLTKKSYTYIYLTVYKQMINSKQN